MRLAAQAKGSFYPTPPRVTDLIAELIQPPAGYARSDETLRILDPCCGEGDALSRLAEGLRKPHAAPVETFGVELHSERAEEAKGRLDHVLGADLFGTAIANGAFGLLYLNPPYDWDSGEEKRVEHAFLTHCTRYLAEDGLLVLVVPRQRLAVSARYLASHFSRIDCWAFPEPEREAYDQVVLLGYRKAEVFLDAYAEERIHRWAVGEAETLSPSRYPLYVAPATAAPPWSGRWARARPSLRPPPPTWPASGGCSSFAHRTSRASGSARSRTPSPTPAPSSSPPSPTWSACASPTDRGRSSWSCRGSARNSPTAGCRRSSSAGQRSTAGSCGMRRPWSRSGCPAARTASPRSSTGTGCP